MPYNDVTLELTCTCIVTKKSHLYNPVALSTAGTRSFFFWKDGIFFNVC